jgi:alcohol dehydrogenase class IV
MESFHFRSFAQEVIFAPGAPDQIGLAVEGLEVKRFLLCASRSMEASGTTRRIESLLGQRLVAVYAGVQPPVLDVQVAEALELAVRKRVDGIIGLGGGSPIGLAKAVAYSLREKRLGRATRSDSRAASRVPVVAASAERAGQAG